MLCVRGASCMHNYSYIGSCCRAWYNLYEYPKCMVPHHFSTSLCPCLTPASQPYHGLNFCYTIYCIFQFLISVKEAVDLNIFVCFCVYYRRDWLLATDSCICHYVTFQPFTVIPSHNILWLCTVHVIMSMRYIEPWQDRSQRVLAGRRCNFWLLQLRWRQYVLLFYSIHCVQFKQYYGS